jgi:hypothetical protein
MGESGLETCNRVSAFRLFGEIAQEPDEVALIVEQHLSQGALAQRRQAPQ